VNSYPSAEISLTFSVAEPSELTVTCFSEASPLEDTYISSLVFVPSAKTVSTNDSISPLAETV
jgi:hypothetical protein